MKGLVLVVFVVLIVQVKSLLGGVNASGKYTPYLPIASQEEKLASSYSGPSSIEEDHDTQQEIVLNTSVDLTSDIDGSQNEMKSDCKECLEVIEDINNILENKLTPQEIINLDSFSSRVGLKKEAIQMYKLVIEKELNSGEILDQKTMFEFIKNPF